MTLYNSSLDPPTKPRGEPIKNPSAYVATGSDDVGMLFAVGGEDIPAALEKAIKRLRGAALRSPANRVICEERLLPELRKALLRPDCAKSILNSHLITKQAHDALLTNELSEFFELRRAAIWEAEKQWLHQRGGKANFQADPRKYSTVKS